MKKQSIDVRQYANQMIGAIPRGVLLTTKAADKVNSMVIGWGSLGTIWGKAAFTVHVRHSRFTKELLDQNPEFTINIPTGDYDKKIMSVCGSQSGRDIDKIKETNLTIVEGEKVSVPGFKELPLTLECKVIYRQEQDMSLIPQGIQDRFYPVEDGVQDAHITYIGEIVNAYLVLE